MSIPAVAALAHDLMSIDSTSGDEGPLVEVVRDVLEAMRWHVTLIPVTEGRHDIFARTGDDVEVTLSTHLDTVPPWIRPSLRGDVLAGRGACDAKGIAAAMILAAGRLRDLGRGVGLLLVVGEETSHDGAHAANDWAAANLPERRRVLIDGEPTGSTLGLGTKGAQRLTLKTRGRAAHSAYPSLGRSATLDLVRLLAELDGMEWPSDPLLGETTVNIGMVSGGVADNVLAPSAEARLMFRLVSDAGVVRRLVEDWVAGRAELEWGVTVPPVRLTTVGGFATSVAAFATDIPALSRWGTPYLFGPGSVHVAHTLDEEVSVGELEAAVLAYERLAVAALGEGA